MLSISLGHDRRAVTASSKVVFSPFGKSQGVDGGGVPGQHAGLTSHVGQKSCSGT